MKNRRIEVNIGKTVNFGDFESIKISIGLSEDIQDKDNLDESFDKICEEVGHKLADYCEQLEKEHSNKNKRIKSK